MNANKQNQKKVLRQVEVSRKILKAPEKGAPIRINIEEWLTLVRSKYFKCHSWRHVFTACALALQESRQKGLEVRHVLLFPYFCTCSSSLKGWQSNMQHDNN
jgi:hypothetical protein